MRWPGCWRRRGDRGEARAGPRGAPRYACVSPDSSEVLHVLRARAARLVIHGHRGRPAGAAAVTTGYLPGLGDALRHGPGTLCAFAVTPGALIVIARVLERRWLLPHEQFAAVTYGDPLLAVALGVGVWLTGPRVPHGLTGLPPGSRPWRSCWGSAWRSGVTSCGADYTRAQAAAPTKIWHQVVVYPVMGYWLWTACIRRAVGARRGGRLDREGPAGGAGRGLGGDQRVRPPPPQARPPAVRLAPGPAPGAALGGRVADPAGGGRVLRTGPVVRRSRVLRSFAWVTAVGLAGCCCTQCTRHAERGPAGRFRLAGAGPGRFARDGSGVPAGVRAFVVPGPAAYLADELAERVEQGSPPSPPALPPSHRRSAPVASKSPQPRSGFRAVEYPSAAAGRGQTVRKTPSRHQVFIPDPGFPRRSKRPLRVTWSMVTDSRSCAQCGTGFTRAGSTRAFARPAAGSPGTG